MEDLIMCIKILKIEQFLVEKATFFDFSFFYFHQKMADY